MYRHESQLCCDFTVADPRIPAADECRIFTLRGSWIWAWCTEKAFRHARKDRLNTAAESRVIRLLTKLRNTAKTHSSKKNNSCVLSSSEFLVVYSPYISKKYIVACKTPSCFFPDKFIQRGEETHAVLHRLVSHGKKLFLITNSPFGFV